MRNHLIWQTLIAAGVAFGLVVAPLNSTLVAQSARLLDDTPSAPAEESPPPEPDTDTTVKETGEAVPVEPVNPPATDPSVETPLVESNDGTAIAPQPESTPEPESQPSEPENTPEETRVATDSEIDPTLSVEHADDTAVPQSTVQPSETDTTTPSTELPTEQVLASSISDETKSTEEETIFSTQWESGKVLLQLKDGTGLLTLTNLLAELGFKAGELDKTTGALLVDVPVGKEAESAALIQSLAGIRYAEPVYTATAFDVTPNDPAFPSQTNMLTINAPGGWQYFTGSAKVIVAIIDTGIDLTNPDFAGRIVQGYDFVNDDDTAMDDNGHGTHVAGIVAATGNNSYQLAGLDWAAKIMPIKVLNNSGTGSALNVSKGIIYAVDHGAQIINLSLGFDGYSAEVASAVEYAYQHGVTVVAASGNTNSAVNFPANLPHVIAVGAVDDDENRWVKSNYGSELDLVAPGKDVLSSGLIGPVYKSGTSMAAAHVTGLASLLRGISPLKSDQIEKTMKSTSKDLGTTGWDQYFGSGLIQVKNALKYLFNILFPPHREEPADEQPPRVIYPTFTPTMTPTITPTFVPTIILNNG